jgi:hypothetical protein
MATRSWRLPQAADGGHVSLVEVAKVGRGLPSRSAAITFGGVAAHLHGGLGNAGNRMPILLKMSKIAADEDFGQPIRIQLLIDDHCAALIHGGAQHAA